MATIDRKRPEFDDNEPKKLTSRDLENILEVNKKAVEIYIEVERQNEDLLDNQKKIITHVTEIDKNLFKLIIILSSLGIGTIVGFIELILNHK